VEKNGKNVELWQLSDQLSDFFFFLFREGRGGGDSSTLPSYHSFTYGCGVCGCVVGRPHHVAENVTVEGN